MLINSLLFFLVLLRLVIGCKLLLSASQNKLNNLNWLGVQFLLQSAGLLFSPTVGNPLAGLSISLSFFVGATLGSQIVLIYFNHLTFYRNRKSPIGWFGAVFVVCGLITLYGILISESNYQQSLWVAAYIPMQWLIWGWHGYIAYQAWQEVRQNNQIEDWVKSRYRLLISYVIFILIGSIASFFRITLAGGSNLTLLGTIMGIITLIAQVIGVILQFLVWVMPEIFRRWLNRHQQERMKAMAREQAIVVLDILAVTMAQTTGLTKLNSVLALRKAVEHMITLDEGTPLEAYIAQMGYDEWLAFLDSSALRLIILASSQMDVYEVARKMRQTLIDKQSLFTMRAK